MASWDQPERPDPQVLKELLVSMVLMVTPERQDQPELTVRPEKKVPQERPVLKVLQVQPEPLGQQVQMVSIGQG
jgi:hypothetical protein